MYKIEVELQNKNNVSSVTISEDLERTTAFCTVEGPSHLQTRNEDFKSLIIDVKWRGHDPKHYNSKYYSHIIKSILEHFIILELDSCKSICISLYITGSTKFSLLSSVNAALLGMVNTGIPLKGMFYALQNGDKVSIFDSNEVVFDHFINTNNNNSCENLDENLENIFKYTKEVINFSISQQHTI